VFQQLQRPHPVSCKSTRRAGLGVLIQYMDHIEDFSDEPYSDDNFDCCAPDDRYAQAAIFRRFQFLQQHHHSSRRIIHDQHQVCCLPGHLCPPRSAGLAARQQPPESLKLGCPPPLHAQALARGPLAAVRLHQAVCSGTPHAAVRHLLRRCCQRGRTPAASRRLPGQLQQQAPPTATRPPSFGIHAGSGVPSVSSTSQDQQSQHLQKSVIPTHCSVTEQLTKNWTPFKVLRQHYAGTRFEEQCQLLGLCN
jgi:hypothetical protein